MSGGGGGAGPENGGNQGMGRGANGGGNGRVEDARVVSETDQWMKGCRKQGPADGLQEPERCALG